jgi:hypothetical protein
MKRFYTLLSLLVFATGMFAQSQRMVLFEHFTQASCPPCASTNPPLFATMSQNTDKIIPISYQVYWPGYDPMFDHNPNEIRDRVTYYGVSAAPNSVMDGNGPLSSLSLGSQANINARAAITSPFTIETSHKVSDRFDEVEVTVEITASTDINRSMVAQIAIVEHEIHFNSPPGTNGETLFHNVMKKMLPGADGTDLPTSWAAGDKQTLTYSWKFKNVYDVSEIAVIAWVQDENSKEVLQASFSEPNLTAAGPNDGLTVRASASGDFENTRVCGNVAQPVVEILNAGSANLTSLDIYYSINNGPEEHYEWTGNLAYLAKAIVILPDYNFVNQTTNTINVRTANPNGQQDDQTSNDEYAVTFKPSLQVSTNAKVEVRPLTNPSKLTWELKGSNGTVVASGGPYTTPLLAQTTDVTLDADECYTLNFKNTATSFNGTLKLIDSEGKEKLKLDADPNLNSNTVIGTNLALNVDNVINTAALNVYPNPVSGQFQIDLEMKKSSEVSFQVYNMLGQMVKNQVANLTTGSHQQSMNVSQLQKGMYILKIQTQEGSVSKTFVKE